MEKVIPCTYYMYTYIICMVYLVDFSGQDWVQFLLFRVQSSPSLQHKVSVHTHTLAIPYKEEEGEESSYVRFIL